MSEEMEEGGGEAPSGYRISKINAASYQFQRLGNLWNKAHLCSSSGRYKEWNTALEKIWSELAGDLDPSSADEIEYNKFSEQLSKTGLLLQPLSTGFAKVPSKIHVTASKQFSILLAKEIWLRRLQNKIGKGTAYLDQDEFGLD